MLALVLPAGIIIDRVVKLHVDHVVGVEVGDAVAVHAADGVGVLEDVGPAIAREDVVADRDSFARKIPSLKRVFSSEILVNPSANFESPICR